MLSAGEVMKTDQAGRVRTPRARQEELLDEFERGGVSGAKFAAVVGVKYQTFAAWVKRRRKERGGSQPAPMKGKSAIGWVEAVIEKHQLSNVDEALVIHLPGGTRIEVKTFTQATLAAQLIKLLAEGQPATC